MASDRRTRGRLTGHRDQLRPAFGRARRMDACCRTCLCSCASDLTRVAKSSPLAAAAIERSVSYGDSLTHIASRWAPGVVPMHAMGAGRGSSLSHEAYGAVTAQLSRLAL